MVFLGLQYTGTDNKQEAGMSSFAKTVVRAIKEAVFQRPMFTLYMQFSLKSFAKS